MDRYERLANAFVGLADTLVADYDAIELAQELIDSCMALLPVTAAGIVLGDANGALHVFASSSEQTWLLELLELESGAGPCLEAYRSGSPGFVDDLTVDTGRWPEFAERAAQYGFRSISALPMRLRDERIGALNLFRGEIGALPRVDIAVGQALADVATIGILHQRIMNRSEIVNQQLQTALNTRTVIEQAKGVLAERGMLEMDEAFVLLRRHARDTQQRLAELARDVVEGADTSDILAGRTP
jgi:hypothetical protein